MVNERETIVRDMEQKVKPLERSLKLEKTNEPRVAGDKMLIEDLEEVKEK